MLNPGSKKVKNQAAYQSNFYDPAHKKAHKKTKSMGMTPVGGSNFNINFYQQPTPHTRASGKKPLDLS